jgi:hypothetical protein
MLVCVCVCALYKFTFLNQSEPNFAHISPLVWRRLQGMYGPKSFDLFNFFCRFPVSSRRMCASLFLIQIRISEPVWPAKEALLRSYSARSACEMYRDRYPAPSIFLFLFLFISTSSHFDLSSHNLIPVIIFLYIKPKFVCLCVFLYTLYKLTFCLHFPLVWKRPKGMYGPEINFFNFPTFPSFWGSSYIKLRFPFKSPFLNKSLRFKHTQTQTNKLQLYI